MSPKITTGRGRALYVSTFADCFPGPTGEQMARRLDQEDMRQVMAVVSWRGAVWQADVCPVSLALQYLDLLQEESCGRCGPCRIGTQVMRRTLRRLSAGEGKEEDLDELRSLAEQISESALCGVSDTLREPILGLLEAGIDHFLAHASGRTCPDQRTFGWVTAPCRSTCPSNVDCPTYIFQAAEDHPHLSAGVVKRDCPLPAVIGRVCRHPCEDECTLAPIGEPVAINQIKRWAADRAEGLVEPASDAGRPSLASRAFLPGGDMETPDGSGAEMLGREGRLRAHGFGGGRGEPVCVVGAGPAGLSAAYYLARRGYRPVIYEALEVPGGMLYVGIPEYRLPKAVVLREVELIQHEGVEIRYGQRLGRDFQIADLHEMGYSTAFIGIGAHSGKRLSVPGEDLPGSMDAIDFLRQVALGEEVTVGEKVLVVGGGNSAMDAARTAVRLGAGEVQVVYRRGHDEMLANPWEVKEAEEEGVEFRFLAAPVRCVGEECVVGLVCQDMELGPPDASGRRRSFPADCEPFEMEADTVIAAVGQRPDFSAFLTHPAIELNKWGYPIVNPHTLMTTEPGIFVGGDALSGGATVIEAIWAGKTAAKYIDLHLRGEPAGEDIADATRRLAAYLGAAGSRYPLSPVVDYGKREETRMLEFETRKRSFAPVVPGFTTVQARRESKRCLRCHRPILVAY